MVEKRSIGREKREEEAGEEWREDKPDKSRRAVWHSGFKQTGHSSSFSDKWKEVSDTERDSDSEMKEAEGVERHRARNKESRKTVWKTGRKRDAAIAEKRKQETVGDRPSSMTEPEQKTLYPWTRRSWRSVSTGSLYPRGEKIPSTKYGFTIFITEPSLVSASSKRFGATEDDSCLFPESCMNL